MNDVPPARPGAHHLRRCGRARPSSSRPRRRTRSRRPSAAEQRSREAASAHARSSKVSVNARAPSRSRNSRSPTSIRAASRSDSRRSPPARSSGASVVVRLVLARPAGRPRRRRPRSPTRPGRRRRSRDTVTPSRSCASTLSPSVTATCRMLSPNRATVRSCASRQPAAARVQTPIRSRTPGSLQ